MNITEETRRESYVKIIPKRETRKEIVLSILRDGDKNGMTAEEVLDRLFELGKVNKRDMNYVRPRLTELKESGKIKVVGSRLSSTARRTAVWKVV